MKRKYNWRPDLPDHRDLYHQISGLSLPRSFDLRPKCPPVFNQGQIGSCTGNALAGAMGFLEPSFGAFSRLFIYYNERAIEGTIDQDHGASLRDGIKVLHKKGACRESVWDYSEKKLFTQPSTKAYLEAQQHEIVSYARMTDNPMVLKSALAGGFPFVFGFTVYESFESPQVAKTGKMPMPSKAEQILGGHAVMAVGYDDNKSVFIVRNSWGKNWGASGYFYMPYAYIFHAGLARDFWVIKK